MLLFYVEFTLKIVALVISIRCSFGVVVFLQRINRKYKFEQSFEISARVRVFELTSK